MKLRTQFILFLVISNTVLVIFAALLLPVNRFLFIAAELGILLSILLSVRLYKAYIRPLNLITSGIESLKGKDFTTTFVSVGQTELDQLIEMYNAMICELRAERVRQQEQHFFLEKLIEASPVGIMVLNLDEQLTALNPSAARLLGVSAEEVLGKPLSHISGSLAGRLTSLESGRSQIIHVGQKSVRVLKSDFLEKGFNRSFIIFEEFTKELHRTEKQAYGKVIRMMSHEVNNSVGAINSILSSALNYKEQLTPDDREDFSTALHVAIERNTKLNQFMANFADVIRTPEPTIELCDLHGVITHVTTLMTDSCDAHGIDLRLSLQGAEFLVRIDVQQFEQVLVNILKNAIEALEGCGWIEIETRKNGQKMLIIRNNGQPIPKDVQSRLFTPFYSTKKEGQGIGLTLTKEILHNHGCRFSLETVDGEITEFTIVFEEM